MLKSNSLKNPTHDLSIPEILKSHLVAELLDQGNHHCDIQKNVAFAFHSLAAI